MSSSERGVGSVKEDQQYLQLLERFRHAECNYSDYELLLTRVVRQPTVTSLRHFPWNKVHFLFFFEIHFIVFLFRLPLLCSEMEYEPRSKTKQQIERQRNWNTGCWYASLKIPAKGKQIKDPILVKKLLELSDSKTDHLPQQCHISEKSEILEMPADMRR